MDKLGVTCELDGGQTESIPGKARTAAVGREELALVRLFREVGDEPRGGGEGQPGAGLEDHVSRGGSLL